MHASLVEDTDWVRATQSQFPPTRISERLWIVPTWHEPPDPKAIAVRLDPGVAFGTGTHPTTRLCLRWLDANLTCRRDGARLRLRLRHPRDRGRQARRGARSPGPTSIRRRCRRRAPTPMPTRCAPITLNRTRSAPEPGTSCWPTSCPIRLKLLAPALLARVAPGGALVLSGVLERQADEVIEAYRRADAGVAAVGVGRGRRLGLPGGSASALEPLTRSMALATKCPQCGALFRVVADQLKLRGGLVRCGQCRAVFDAIGSLTYVDDTALAQSRTVAGAARSTAPAPAPPADDERARDRRSVRRPRCASAPVAPATLAGNLPLRIELSEAAAGRARAAPPPHEGGRAGADGKQRCRRCSLEPRGQGADAGRRDPARGRGSAGTSSRDVEAEVAAAESPSPAAATVAEASADAEPAPTFMRPKRRTSARILGRLRRRLRAAGAAGRSFNSPSSSAAS